jgi:hypothetical protein
MVSGLALSMEDRWYESDVKTKTRIGFFGFSTKHAAALWSKSKDCLVQNQDNVYHKNVDLLFTAHNTFL